MKKSILLVMAAMVLSSLLLVQSAVAQVKKDDSHGVTIKVLTENEHVKVSEITFEPGGVTDWHMHPQHTIYAITDAIMKVETEGKETTTSELKAGHAVWSPPVMHRVTSLSKKPYTVIVTEIK